MKIGPELIFFNTKFPYKGSFTVTVPEIIIRRDSYYGDLDFGLVFNSALVLSKYEYGYCLKIALLGVGFEIWVSRNLN
jgi:hypothetical protein